MVWFVVLILPFIVSLAACRALIAVSVRDAPDGDRKLQAHAVPTAGGVAILAAIACSLLALVGLAGIDPVEGARQLAGAAPLFAVIVLVLGAGAIGLVDDWIGLPALIKGAALLGLSGFAATQLPAVDVALPWLPEVTDGPDARPIWMVAGIALWLFVFTNGANFMDGADGLAFGSLAVMLVGIAIGLGSVYAPMLEYVGPGVWLLLLAPVVAVSAIAGFLVWNLRGRLYGGDTGALAMGALVAGLGAYVAAHVGIWFVAVLALPFLVDVLLTIIYRVSRGQNPLTAHREHAYQLFIKRGASAVRVALLWWVFCFACVAAAVAILLREPDQPGFGAIMFAGLTVFGCLLWTWQRIALGRRSAPQQPALAAE